MVMAAKLTLTATGYAPSLHYVHYVTSKRYSGFARLCSALGDIGCEQDTQGTAGRSALKEEKS